MPTAAVRLATPDDAAEIARVHVASWRVAYSGLIPEHVLADLDVSTRSDAWRRILSAPDETCYIASVGNEIVGFTHIADCRDADKEPGRVGEVTAIYVEPTFWRRGYGSTLMMKALQTLRSRNYSEIALWVLRDHTMARNFYEAFGFVPDGTQKTHAKSGLIEVRYARQASTDDA